MKRVGGLTRTLIGTPALAIMLLALGACGPQVASGDENSVFVKAGPLSSVSDAESAARSHCAQYGKHAALEGSDPNSGTLQDTYRFDCVDDPQ